MGRTQPAAAGSLSNWNGWREPPGLNQPNLNAHEKFRRHWAISFSTCAAGVH
jgi:hypothetical protein